MLVSEIELFEILSQQLGKEKAKALVEYVEMKIDKRLEEKKSEFILERDKDKLLTKADAVLIFATKEDLARQIGDSKSEIIKWMFIFWVGTIGVLSGIMLAILHSYLK